MKGCNYNNILNDIKTKIINIDKNVKFIKENLELNKLDKENLSKNKIVSFEKVTAIITVLVSAASLTVSLAAWQSSERLTINNSALNFAYKKIDVKRKDAKSGIIVEVGKEAITQGEAKIYIDIEVLTGQISSLYLIQKKNDELIFRLLNDGKIQSKSDKVSSYSTDIYFDMKKETERNGVPIGMAQVYILSEDLNGKIDIDTIQIIGSIVQEVRDNITYVYDDDSQYSFRYLKNNKLITLYGDDNVDDEWTNMTEIYSEDLKETNIEEIENDIAAIREKYSRYKY